ncbi:MAG TPA: DUF4867 family protein [Chloroflexi bacterium]|jgi:hypothetical protein|nr:DUF4867 family protein [Chloroflexota bacterium]
MPDSLSRLRAANPALNLLPVSDPAFERYGRFLTRYDPSEVMATAQALLPRAERVVYEPSVAALEAPSAFNTAVMREVFGGMPTQVGWCYGQNLRMAGLEYHKASEVNVCLTDAILLVGHVQDIAFGERITYDTRQVAAFFAPAGAVVELSPWNLHFAPIHTTQGGSFATLVYLPKGTNEPLPYTVDNVGENRLLAAVNKWLLVHPDMEGMVQAGLYPGLVGDDIIVTPV